MRRAEKVQADHVPWATRPGGNPVDIEIGGIGCQQRIRAGDLVETGEDAYLRVDILETGPDQDVAIGERLETGRRHQFRLRLLPFRSRSDERRVGKECVRPGRSRWSPTQQKKKQ